MEPQAVETTVDAADKAAQAADAVSATAVAVSNTSGTTESLMYITMDTLQLMGYSFIAGSLFTVLLLMVLDLMKLARESREQSKA